MFRTIIASGARSATANSRLASISNRASVMSHQPNTRLVRSQPLLGKTKFCTNTAKAKEWTPEPYSKLMQFNHWTGALGIGMCIASVKVAQKDKSKRKDAMFYHKSVGLLMLALLVPRLGARLLTKKIPPPPPGNMLETLAAKASHLSLYFFLAFMPISGVIMGYNSGFGLPFFYTTLKGAEQPDKALAKQFYGYHKQAGELLTYLVPLHIGAVWFHHLVKGQKILKSMNPFL